MTRAHRVASVTAALALAGAGCGAVAAAGGFALLLVLTARGTPGEYAMLADWGVMRVVAGIGAVLGAALGPLVAWTALRTVPLGSALAAVTLGTGVGAASGAALLPYGALIGAVTGAFVASVTVRGLAQRRRARLAAVPEPASLLT